ncbi:unnamed protein product [Heligmosomoides polygyrus]|uniref:G_PROTEIN_RECEP_F1_2 domain-containing protein n=1 Tax=Heligmosomoides polygyrus TaxID=6339 RepID=A0A183FYV6_HELPZ|nr:unnamed protein product [Heligmosomoides polygyrus]
MFVTLPDVLYMVTITVNGVLGIVTNAFLLYLIVRKSPPQLTPYRIFLANTALTQLLYACVMIMDPVVFYLFIYLCNFCRILVHFAVNSFISIMLSMLFRCVSLKTLRFPVSGAYAMCLAGYFIPVTMVASVVNMEFVTDFESNDRYLNHTVPNLERYHTVVGTKACLIWVIFCTSFLLVPIYAVMYFCRWKIYRLLSRPTHIHNHSTTNNIQRLVKALTVQSLIPLFTVFPSSLSYMLGQFGAVHFHMHSYFTISCLSFGR